MSNAWLTLGKMRIAPISDGHVTLAPEQFLPDADWDAHRAMLEPDGSIRLDVGAFVVRTEGRTVLIDAGFGKPVDDPMAPLFQCGHLPEALAGYGIAPGEIDTVLCTHLHRDHAGWLLMDGKPFFENATVRFGSADWDALIADEAAPAVGEELRSGMRLLAELGRLEPIDHDMTSIATGITTRHAPGHTPGHQIVVLGSGEDRMVILGDAIACPLQIDDTSLDVTADVDPAMSRRTREMIVREMSGTRVSGPHFPGLAFGRIMKGSGRSHFTRP